LIETEIEIRTPDAAADGLFYQPERNGSWPGVFFFTDISGIRASQRAMAARICSEGYTVAMPNLYYRTGKPPLFEPGLKFGDEKFMRRMGELLSPLIPKAVERDAGSYVDFLAQQTAVKKGDIRGRRLVCLGRDCLAHGSGTTRSNRSGCLFSWRPPLH